MEGSEPMEVDVVSGDTTTPLMQIQLNEFDTVVAITQQAINAHFKNLWKIGAIHKNLSIALNPKRKLEGAMEPPRVKVGTGDTKYITFILPISSGSFSYLNLDEEPETVEIKDWKLAFKVRVDYRTIDKEEVPQEVWERVKNLGNGMFSIRQLFMDFQTANFAELDLSESVVPKSVVDSGYLAMYMKRYFAKVTEDGHNILGYAVQVQNPNQTMPECPSFPPTDLTFATHRYEDGTSAPNPDYDTLTYLIMTRNRPMPLNTLPQGQFFDPKAQDKQSGTMIIARSVFIDDYLIPRLARSTALQGSLTKIGDRGLTFDIFAGDGEYKYIRGQWEHTDEQSAVSETFALWNALFPSNLTWKLTNTSKVLIVPATNKILLSGVTSFYHENHCWAGVRGDNNALQEIVWQQANSSWSILLTFNSVSTVSDLSGGGELNVDVNFNLDHSYQEGGNILGELELQINDEFKKQGQRISETVSTLMNNHGIGDSVKRALQNTATSLAAGYMNIAAPTFTGHGQRGRRQAKGAGRTI